MEIHGNISKDIFQSAAEEAMNQDVNSDRYNKLPQAVTLLDYTLLGLDNDGHWDEFIFGQGISVLLSFSLGSFTVGIFGPFFTHF